MLDSGGAFLKHLEDAANPPLVELTTGAMVDAVGATGLAAMNLGRIDLLLGADRLAKLASRARFPLLSANVVDADGRAPFARWTVLEVGRARVGVFGLAGNQTLPDASSPKPALAVTDPIAAAKRAVAELRTSCGLVIALSQLGLEEDARLAREVPGIDVVLGGYTRALLPTPRVEGSTLILHAGAKGMRVGKLELELRPGSAGPWVPRATATPGAPRVYAWSLVPLDAAIPDHPALVALLERHREELRARQLASQEAAPQPRAAPSPAGQPYVGAAACGTCHPRELEEWSRTGHARAMAGLARKRQDLNPECVRCHVTAFGEPGGYRPRGTESVDLANVQCEACHGFGREHRGKGKIRGRVPETICRRCHTTENSPTFRYEPYLRRLGAHAERHFLRQHEPAPPAAR